MKRCARHWRVEHIVRAAGPHQLPDGSISQRNNLSMRRTVTRAIAERRTPGHAAPAPRRAHGGGVCDASASYVASELAYHFEAGAEWARAVTYLRLVADTATQAYAFFSRWARPRIRFPSCSVCGGVI